MLVAIISDIHDNIWNLAKALQIIQERGCQLLLCCGDICSPFTAARLSEANIPTEVIFGNNDGDIVKIISQANSQMKFHSVSDEYVETELDGKKIAFCHYPKYANFLANSGQYQAVFFGHNHLQSLEQLGQTVLCNPGPLCGIVAGGPGPATFALYETKTGKVEQITLP